MKVFATNGLMPICLALCGFLRWSCLATLFFTGSAIADEVLGPQFTAEQIKIEFDIHQRKESGTLFYECTVSVCGKGSLVSEHPQETSSSPDAKGLESFVRDWLLGLRAAYSNRDIHGEIFKTSFGKTRPRADGTNFSYAIALVQLSAGKGGLDGMEDWWAVGFLTDDHGSMTFASSSTDKDMAWRNANGIMSFTATFVGK